MKLGLEVTLWGHQQGFGSFTAPPPPRPSQVTLTEVLGVGGSRGGDALLVDIVVDLPADRVPTLEGAAAHQGRVQVVGGHEALAEHVVVLLEANGATCRARGGVRAWAHWDNASHQPPNTRDSALGDI